MVTLSRMLVISSIPLRLVLATSGVSLSSRVKSRDAASRLLRVVTYEAVCSTVGFENGARRVGRARIESGNIETRGGRLGPGTG
jgi:hypothetical protein